MKTSRNRMKKHAVIAGVAILCALGAGYICLYPALETGAGTIAHQLCSQAFVSDLPQEITSNELLPNLVGPAMHLANYGIDGSAATVDASLLFVHARAKYRNGWGCRLEFDEPA